MRLNRLLIVLFNSSKPVLNPKSSPLLAKSLAKLIAITTSVMLYPMCNFHPSANHIVKRTILGGNIDPEKIIPFIKTAQDKYLLLILGTVLFDKMQDDIAAGTLTGRYLTLQNEYIIDTIVHYGMVEAQLMPEELRAKVIQSVSTNLDGSSQGEFERRAKVAELILKEREIQTKENIVEAQMQRKVQ